MEQQANPPETSREFDPLRDRIATQAATIEHLRQMLASANRYNDRLFASRQALIWWLAVATVALLLAVLTLVAGGW